MMAMPQSGLAFVVTAFLSGTLGIALMQAPAHRGGGELVTAAQQFLVALPERLREKASAPLGDPARLEWHYVPREYPGVALFELDDTQRGKADALLRAVLSAQGIRKVEAILALEDVLKEVERQRGQSGASRDPLRYWLQVFGTPDAQAPWAFRLQGHHVSLHFTVERGALCAATPTFLGSHPHEVPSGPHRGERVLGRIEDLARGLLATLTDGQMATAVIAAQAPPDVVAGPGRDAGKEAPQGLVAAAMDATQQDLLWRLVREFVEDHEGAFAASVLQRIDAAGRGKLHFAWAGSTQRGQGHYFRVHGPTLWIEYDNTQDGSNHVHALYRDLERDFGGDPLRLHLERDHGVRAPR
jgi:hypothetical protein